MSEPIDRECILGSAEVLRARGFAYGGDAIVNLLQRYDNADAELQRLREGMGELEKKWRAEVEQNAACELWEYPLWQAADAVATLLRGRRGG